MSHHGDGMPKLPDFMRNMMAEVDIDNRISQAAEELGLGATNAFPQGRLNDDDEGELQLAVARDKDKVILNFGKPIAWIGLDAESAHQIADLLKRHADEIDSDS